MLEFFGRLAPCVVAMEACGSAHHWGRQLVALGHEVKLIPPAHVKPYLRPATRRMRPIIVFRKHAAVSCPHGSF
jgi:transposase